ncbi:MAG: hypothetical protein LQ351_000379 [Letrouitia transgressa]|nr:MAG: hypothetical protein LQ351_000379 [Letrouitia transgressa]
MLSEQSVRFPSIKKFRFLLALSANLAGRDWWSLQTKNYTVNEPAAILEVGFSKHIGRGGQIEYIKGPTTQPVSSPNHGVYATSVHLRNSSSISRSSYIESPRQSMQSIGYQSVVNAQSSQAGKPSNPTFQSQSHSSWRDPQYNAKLEETVNYHNKAPPNTPSRKREPAKGLGEHKEVIIRNLQLVVTKKTVRAALMEKVGIIDSCEIEVDGESRLCATVGFAEGRDALKAVRQLHKTQFLGTLVSVQLTEKEGRNPVIINNSISDFDSGGEVMGHRHRQGNF